MNVFELRKKIIDDYAGFARSFTKIRAKDLSENLDAVYGDQRYWPEPKIQLNPSFEMGHSVAELSRQGVLHAECSKIFRFGKSDGEVGQSLHLFRHQLEAVSIASQNEPYVLTTGTGSGKSLAYFIPIINSILQEKEKDATPRTRAIIIYPMNALANSQVNELEKFLGDYPPGEQPITFARYTGQEDQEERERIATNPPDILLTNFMMLELLMVRHNETDRAVINAAKDLGFLVLDELHTYRGRQGADVAMLIRRVREALNPNLTCIGTSATMSSEGTVEARNRVVAEVASKLFGQPVPPVNVITETLRWVTEPAGIPPSKQELAESIGSPMTPADYDAMRSDALARWIEQNMGLDQSTDKPTRAKPLSLTEAASRLAEDSGMEAAECKDRLEAFLLQSSACRNDEGRSLFAFKLHQFVSGAGKLSATLEEPGDRVIDLGGQQFVPGNRNRRFFGVHFCRECGHEYHPVWFPNEEDGVLEPREIDETAFEDEGEVHHGYFTPDVEGFWTPEIENFPEAWLDHSRGEPRVKSSMKRFVPKPLKVGADGQMATVGGVAGWLIPGRFRFCVHCRKSYGMWGRESTRLASLSAEGRSSATTLMTMSGLRHLLKGEMEWDENARKILSFTDNRQDASLQAGHFNDFIHVLLLRSAILGAIEASPGGELGDRDIAAAIMSVLGLDRADNQSEFSGSSEELIGMALRRAQETVRDLIGYRAYFDLRRGWRYTNPNLDQLGILSIDYEGVAELAGENELWRDCGDRLASASPEVRGSLLRDLLDQMRTNLCIRTRYLERSELDRLRNASLAMGLKEPWGLPDDELLEESKYATPDKIPDNRDLKPLFASVSPRSRFGISIRRPSGWGFDPADSGFIKPKDEECGEITRHLLRNLERYGLVVSDEVSRGIQGYRISGEVIRWRVRDEDQCQALFASGTKQAGQTDNRFFRTLYRNVAAQLSGNEDRMLFRLHAREHTAQVDAITREEREKTFHSADLPLMFCSPTMELGVDISSLNTVYLRNVPPTPANYAQRSGRAGRSGQPALVITYCSAQSPHDQYFFSDPVRMVHGQVSPPTLDLANEDLVRSHLHAVWLNETGQQLNSTIGSLLDMGQEAMPVAPELQEAMTRTRVARNATARCGTVVSMLDDYLDAQNAPWISEEWSDRVVSAAFREFDDSIERWRELYTATQQQLQAANAVITNPQSTRAARNRAEKRHRDATAQLNLLLEGRSTVNSDFYTYRYLASQGFLPGYNFPRLPLLAYIPGSRDSGRHENFIARPRFLGLTEFGPQSLIYHEGRQFRVDRVIIRHRDSAAEGVASDLPTSEVHVCPSCGYGHFHEQRDLERCISCNGLLEGGRGVGALYRIENVSTKRSHRITCNEEERQRQGYEMQTTYRFAERENALRYQSRVFREGGEDLFELMYAPAATVWRINLGWRRRKNPSIFGFNLDTGTGRWCADDQRPPEENDDPEQPESTVSRIVPYVEDRKNILILHPLVELSAETLMMLQYALKRGIEAEFQVEPSELMVEPLPTREDRRRVLFYEAAEGGAGVLTRLASDPASLGRVAAHALEIMHFLPSDEGWRFEDLQEVETACEAGCYRCLLSYFNQPEHAEIDRQDKGNGGLGVSLLCRLTEASSEISTTTRSGETVQDLLQRRSGSSLEQAWLAFLSENSLRQPDRAQPLLEEFGVQPDFAYSERQALVFIDGPHHENARQRQRDSAIDQDLDDAGFVVIRFTADRNSWPEVVSKYPDVFGRPEPMGDSS